MSKKIKMKLVLFAVGASLMGWAGIFDTCVQAIQLIGGPINFAASLDQLGIIDFNAAN